MELEWNQSSLSMALLHTLASIQLVYSEYLPVLQLIALILQYNLQVLKKFRERFEN